jgi:beta-galactosidase/beta-glucuronidase
MTFKKKIVMVVGGICLLLLIPVIYFLKGPKQKTWGPSHANKKVAIVERSGRFMLYRDGKPYYIKGVNVMNCRYLQEAKDAGANSIRVYNTDSAQQILDSAARLGLSVFLGVRMNYADKDMDYSDEHAVAAQFEKIRKEILKFKDHPALLAWGVGNETNLFFYDKPSRILARISICKAINNIAKMIHEVDPDHPAIIPVTGGSSNRVNAFFCDEVDLIGYNSFESFDRQLLKSHWKGPYIVSEFGARGYWANMHTEWYNYPEETSLEKVAFMRRQFETFSSDTNNCLGSYAFLWGHKQEYTSTWFSLYTRHGEQTTMVSALKALWAGKPFATGTSISAVMINHKADSNNIYVKAGAAMAVSLTLTDTLSRNGSLYWEIQPDNVQYLDASLISQRTKVLDSASISMADALRTSMKKNDTQGHLFIKAPVKEGPYRLFLYLKNKENYVATANACFYIHE